MLKGFDPTAAATAFLITAVLLWLLQPVASRFGLLDRPSGRKDHAVPTPVIGGLGILIGCLTAFFVVQADGPGMLAFCTASVMLVAVGLYDDLYDLRWYWRIFVQAAAAVVIVRWGGVQVGQLGSVFGVESFSLGWFSLPATVFVTVGVINAMNMIDGIDGLAGMLGLAALLLLTIVAIDAGNVQLAARTSVLCGALAGFLFWNLRLPWRERAKVFLGDAGSGLLGLVIIWVSLRLTQNPQYPVNPVLALWLLPIPVMDCLVLIVRRLQERRSPFAADRDHIHHLMCEAGFGPTRAALTLMFFSVACGLIVMLSLHVGVPGVVLLALYLAMCVGWYALTRRKQRAIAFFRALRGNASGQRLDEEDALAIPVSEDSDGTP